MNPDDFLGLGDEKDERKGSARERKRSARNEIFFFSFLAFIPRLYGAVSLNGSACFCQIRAPPHALVDHLTCVFNLSILT